MPDDKKTLIHEGFQPLQKGYQPTSSSAMIPAGDKVQGGYQPTTGESVPQPAAPPKKP